MRHPGQATTQTRRCPKCHILLTTDEFLYRTGWCKTCSRKRQKEYYIKRSNNNSKTEPNFEGYKVCTSCNVKKSKKEFHVNRGNNKDGLCAVCRECKKIYNAKHWHGMTEIVYRDLLSKQDSKCAICGNNFKNDKDINIDHDHTTHLNRGLLCFECNTGLGKFKDNVDILAKAITYIKQYSDNL